MKKNRMSSISKCIKGGFSCLLGEVTWKKPSWLSRIHNTAKTSPKRFWGVASLLVLVYIAAIYGANWYNNRPKPIYVTATVTAPDITPNEETLVPRPLTLDFGIQNNGFTAQSIAPIQLIGKTITKGIEMTPKIDGEWVWNKDSQLVFTPSQDWPANQQFKIHTDEQFFAANTLLESHDFTFATKPFQATITQFKFYQDPVSPEKKSAVATILFNYAVNTESLEKNTSLLFEALKKENLKEKPVKFTYTYDENKRVAYLHSDPIKIKEVVRYLLLTLNKEIKTSGNSAPLDDIISKNLLIPDSSNFLKVLPVSATIIRNDKDRPEQVLNIETTLGVNENEFNKSVHFYLLPLNYPATATEEAKLNYQWQNPGEITDNILALATPLSKQAIPTEHNYSSLHSFKIAVQTPRYLYVKVDKGMKGLGDFSLSTNYSTVIPVPELPKEISFLHNGSLLALSGEKKFSVLIRGVPAVKFDLARVLPSNINQLITQTQGDFNNPYFINPSFNQQNISQIVTDIQQFDTSDLAKQQYTALDLGKYLTIDSNTSEPQGLFLIQATGWDVANRTPLDIKASRLILITDLGLLVKDNSDGTHDVFVQSITQGTPLENVKVSILGKNGLEILTRVTDSQGRANFPTLKDFIAEKEPVVYLANMNNDVSFIPFHNEGRNLNFSKFDIGGIYTDSELHNLSAYLFSDRGIYRPGDTVHVGMIVKQAYVQPQVAGLPLQATVRDPRGNSIKVENLVLDNTGYMELNFTTSPNAATGQYRIDLSLMKDNLPQNLLGSVSVQVAEFLPDRMRITTSLLPKPSDGWTSPSGLKAKTLLMNLYSAPATDRRITAKILLTPERIAFKEYPDYIFADPLHDPKKPARVFNETLADIKTNDKGEAEFDLNLDRFQKGTYQLTVFSEGFEAEGGRSVTSQTRALISPLPWFAGYKADGDLTFIKQDSNRTINYIAVNPQLTKEEIKGLKIQLTSLHPVSTLVKNADGTYQYQSIIQSSIISTTPFEISGQGTDYALPTKEIGDYSLSILSKDDTVLSQLKFSVVGSSQSPMAKNAELSIKLNQSEFKAGQDVEIQITAPYTGSGLITIERDKVYASHWFKTDTSNSVQTIRIPADFQGNGYVNVAFIRDWTSPELFISPLSYSVAPFTVNHDNQDIKISLTTPEVARPGEPFTIEYKSDKPGKIIVFAVDEGILQVSHFATPDPLSFFFQKHALEVITQQIVDQILPQFIQARELSAAGGDGAEANLAGRLNPFKRKTDLPVVFWSGIIDTNETSQKLTYQVPDYFNGTIRVMAVAASVDSVGKKDTFSEIRGDFIMNPNVPTFVAPGDEFEISSSVANNVKDSGEHAQITVELTTSPEIEIIGSAKQTLEISEGREQTVHYKLRAKSLLGSSKLTFRATAGNKTSTMSSTLSVRPASPLVTYIDSGMSRDANKTLSVLQTLYPEYRTVDASLSDSPMILLSGLQRYLDNYPFGCTEQLTSKALPLLAMNSQNAFQKDSHKINEKINATIQMLSQRQMSNGGFSYWPGLGENSGNNFASVYAMQFLTEAKSQGFTVPGDLFYNGLGYLKELASQNPSDKDAARLQAYAIYILTANEIVTTNYLANLQRFLQQDTEKDWQHDITGVYIAASFEMLKNHSDAIQLVSQYKPLNKKTLDTDFFNANTSDAQYLYIVAKYFPQRLKQMDDKLVMELVQRINNDEINTVLSGYVSLALGAWNSNTADALPNLSMTETLTDNQTKDLSAGTARYQKQELGVDVKQIRFNNPDKNSFFYQLVQSGFDKSLATTPLKQGLEIFREFRDTKGTVITSTNLGSEIEVHIQIRALDNSYLNNIAIEDLLPGGFEVVRDSVKIGSMDYFDIREDRVIFFGSVDSSSKEIIYKIKATNPGKYKVPPIYAQAMYNPNTKARGVGSEITVSKE